jgi:hypothetical protein
MSLFREIAEDLLLLKTNVHMNLISEAICVLSVIESKVSSQSFSPTAEQFDLNFLGSVLSECLILTHSPNTEFSTNFRAFLDRLIFLAAGYSLPRFAALVSALTTTAEQQQTHSALLYYISMLFDEFSKSDADRLLLLSVELIRDCPISYLCDVNPSFLGRLRDALTVEEISDVIRDLTDTAVLRSKGTTPGYIDKQLKKPDAPQRHPRQPHMFR